MSIQSNFPALRPTIALDFVNTRRLDPNITNSRASSASYYDYTGILKISQINTPRFDYNPATLAAQGLLIEEQRVNLVLYSANFDNSVWGKAFTTTIPNAIVSPNGNVNATKLVETTATNEHYVRQLFVGLTASANYTSSIYIKAGERTAGQVRILDTDVPSNGYYVSFNLTAVTATGVPVGTGTLVAASIANAGNGWYRIAVTGSITGTKYTLDTFTHNPAGTQNYTGDGTSGIYLYGAQLEAGAFATSYAPSVNTFTSRASTGTFFDSVGVLQSAAINVARNTYNPANLAAQPYLLLEEARTNSIRNNTMVGAVAGTPGTLPTNWATVLNGLTQTVVGAGSVNGISYIDIRLNGTTSSAAPIQIKPDGNASISAAAAQVWAMSSWMAVVGGSTANTTGQRFLINEYSAGPTYLRTSLVAANILAGGSSLTRVSAALTLGASTTIIEPIIVLDANSGVAIDITLRIGLPQLEQGAFATSVIPTTTTALTRAADISSSAQATRAADVASVNTLSPWYNATEGTLFAEATTTKTSGPTPTTTIQIAGGASRHQIGMFSAVAATVDTSVVQANIGSNTAQSTKTAYAYKTNDFAVSINGGAVATDTLGTVPTSLSYMTLGKFDFGGGESLNGYLRRITYYPARLSNTQLQALTS